MINLIASDKNSAHKRLMGTIKSVNRESQIKQNVYMSNCSHVMSNTNVKHLTLDDKVFIGSSSAVIVFPKIFVPDHLT